MKHMINHSVSCWAVIPAAGVGRRMGGDRPKQYLPLLGSTVLEHSLQRMASHPRISGMVVALSGDDAYWPQLRLVLNKPLWIAPGGSERADSVLNALEVLAGHAAEHDWVLVHDAARPCLRMADLDTLLQRLLHHPVGGLLGLPVADTVKRVGPADEVLETVDREGLWRALTPQMFRLGELRQALLAAQSAGQAVTDDASAMELTGKRPQMVAGHADNIKITRPEDLPLAELYLRQQANETS